MANKIRPIVLVHGYSDGGSSFQPLKRFLENNGYDVSLIHIANYKTLVNEITIKDIAEAFDKALHEQAKLDNHQPFDAIVHSTGMLVVRSWLTSYAHRKGRLKKLIGLAPATWGSPLAHKGRSWLGALIKGNKDIFDPDFLEAGDLVLDALELGSRFTWDLAHLDLFTSPADTYYGADSDTPWVFTLCGIESYSGLRAIANESGMDGTVRWAGCSMDSRKLVVDLTKNSTNEQRVKEDKKSAITYPVILVEGVNHETILTPFENQKIRNLVLRALEVNDLDSYLKWFSDATLNTKPEQARLKNELGQWQQFIVRAVDERGDSISDYYLELIVDGKNPLRETKTFEVEAHAYKADTSFRCFHLNLNSLGNYDLKNLSIRIKTSTNSHLIRYVAYTNESDEEIIKAYNSTNNDSDWDAILNLSDMPSNISLFSPFITTLIELRLDREPDSSICEF